MELPAHHHDIEAAALAIQFVDPAASDWPTDVPKRARLPDTRPANVSQRKNTLVSAELEIVLSSRESSQVPRK